MSNRKTSVCFGGVLLLFSVFCSSYLSYWLMADTENEKVYNILAEHDRLVTREKRQEAFAYLDKALADSGDGPLDPVWLELVRIKSSGYERLGYYLRVLEGDPEREATYIEIANFIQLAPKAFHEEVKERYLTDMKAIPEVRLDLLEKHGLLVMHH